MRFKNGVVLGFLSLFSVSSAFAQTTGMPDLGTMFANFSSSSIALTQLARVVAFAAGVYFLILSLVRLKQHAESNGREGKLSGVFIIFVVSIFLIVFPTTLNIASNTLALGNSAGSQLSSSGGGGSAGLSGAMEGVILFIQLIGHIGFIRGLFILKGIGDGDRNASLGKAVVFLIGGAAAINIQATVGILAATVAPGLSLPGGLGGI